MSSFTPSFHSKLPDVKTTIFTTVGNMARANQALDVSQGFPNFDPDPALLALVTKAMANGHNQYAPMIGAAPLRDTISEKIAFLHGKTYDSESEITITVGATQAIFTIITAFVHPGDEVVVIKPAYDCYEPAIVVNGGTPVFVQLAAPNYAMDWSEFQSKISSKTRMVIINTPHNPSGRIFSKEDMMQLQHILQDTQILVVSDEVYEHIVFDGKEHESVSRFEDLAMRSFVCASFGKTFHATGWKMGYCAAPATLMHEFRKTHQFNVFCVNHPMQHALAEYLQDRQNYLGLTDFYQNKRNFFLSGLQGSKFTFTPSQGTYFQLLRYANLSDEADVALTKRLILEHKLATIPISVFNEGERDDKIIRICFAKTEDTLQQAAEILAAL
ncbi:methionine aminotransferase [Arenibacter sp. GZD96]|uniref:methionine aminotransferase n=1 Tax=Aurantibrevibacter litoralis TaxID=3106030 RepID=UPI002AFEDD1A|nr:methionine aminotransferase [Arenibacter sp. GZD-96]MEA1786399.1 methionine aminotransferase [Arenibacter sp. GZD-96]